MVDPVIAGLKCVCPRCGEGKLFAGYLKLAPVCTKCGLDLSAEDSADGPAVFLIFILGFAITPVAVIVGVMVDWPMWVQLLLWTMVTTFFALILLRPLKAYTVALQYKHLREGRDKL